MATFKVLFQIEVDAQTSLEAAKTVQGWLQDPSENWQFYTQNQDTMQIDSVDLSEKDDDSVSRNAYYYPFIEK